jgi:hypothetical protein
LNQINLESIHTRIAVLSQVLVIHNTIDIRLLNYIVHPALQNTTINIIVVAGTSMILHRFLSRDVCNQEVTLLLENGVFSHLHFATGTVDMLDYFELADSHSIASLVLLYTQGTGGVPISKLPLVPTQSVIDLTSDFQ